MSHVNLLPPEILEAQRWKRVTFGVGVVGVLVLVAVLGFYLLQTKNLSDVNGDIESQNTTNAGLQAEIADKQEFADLQVESQAKQDLLATAYAGEVSFSTLLMDLSRVIPSDAYIDSLAIQLTEGQAAVEGETSSLVGGITMGGKALSVDSVAVFLTRLEQVEGWVNPWSSNVAADTDISGVAYGMQVDLSTDVITPRGREVADAAG